MTDQDDRFRFDNVPTGCDCGFVAKRLALKIVAQPLPETQSLQPGQSVDMDDHILGDAS